MGENLNTRILIILLIENLGKCECVIISSTIKVTCPKCSISTPIDISIEALKGAERGFLAININQLGCSHNFIVYIDKNLKIRDYFTSDFFLDPSIKNIIKISDINLDLIKLNIPRLFLTYSLRSVFFKINLIFLIDEYVIRKSFLNLLKYIFYNSFDLNITILSTEEYNVIKDLYKDYIVLKGTKIIQNPYNKEILKNTEQEQKLIEQLYLISNYKIEELWHSIQLINKICHEIIKYYSKYKEDTQKLITSDTSISGFLSSLDINKLRAKTIITYLEKELNIEISKNYFHFILDICNNYFKEKIDI